MKIGTDDSRVVVVCPQAESVGHAGDIVKQLGRLEHVVKHARSQNEVEAARFRDLKVRAKIPVQEFGGQMKGVLDDKAFQKSPLVGLDRNHPCSRSFHHEGVAALQGPEFEHTLILE